MGRTTWASRAFASTFRKRWLRHRGSSRAHHAEEPAATGAAAAEALEPEPSSLPRMAASQATRSCASKASADLCLRAVWSAASRQNRADADELIGGGQPGSSRVTRPIMEVLQLQHPLRGRASAARQAHSSSAIEPTRLVIILDREGTTQVKINDRGPAPWSAGIVRNACCRDTPR